LLLEMLLGLLVLLILLGVLLVLLQVSWRCRRLRVRSAVQRCAALSPPAGRSLRPRSRCRRRLLLLLLLLLLLPLLLYPLLL
jgi:hypothetical protein